MQPNVKINVIVGLPGSGKTTFGKSICNDTTLFLDDLSMQPDAVAKFDNNIHDSIVITDPMLCGISRSRIIQKCFDWFKMNSAYFQFYYFENNPAACIVNAVNDPKPGGTTGLIKTLTKSYVIPDNVTVLKVYQPEILK